MRRKNPFLLLVLVFLILACSPIKKAYFNNHFHNEENLFQHHIGFALYDLENEEFIYQHNADKYFTPASNTKIFTLFGSLNLLGDSIPGIEYIVNGDSLIFWGTGDPSLLNSELYNDGSVFNFLKNSSQNLYFSTNNYHNSHFGSGWAWDDYEYSFSAERSPLPIYGNVIEVQKLDSTKSISVSVPYFKRYFYLADSIADYRAIVRGIDNNLVNYYPNRNEFDYSIPFHYSDYLVTQLLTDTLKKSVELVNRRKPSTTSVLYSLPVDSVYKVMMQESDNFLAEQLLLLCSNAISDTINTEIAINYIKDSLLSDLPDKPLWRDGSGLSRYNLFTPRSIIKLWQKINKQVEQERLFQLLAVGGESGTLENYYKADKPYIYGKTGTLSNNHNLSGFILTKSGKVLVFSYMNNNYPGSSKSIKPGMEKLLKEIHENY